MYSAPTGIHASVDNLQVADALGQGWILTKKTATLLALLAFGFPPAASATDWLDSMPDPAAVAELVVQSQHPNAEVSYDRIAADALGTPHSGADFKPTAYYSRGAGRFQASFAPGPSRATTNSAGAGLVRGCKVPATAHQA